jgi:capsular polysaccharide export protein
VIAPNAPLAGRRRIIGVGLRPWKAVQLAPLLSLQPPSADAGVHFVKDAQRARGLVPGAGDALVFWGRNPPTGLSELAARSGALLVRMEDGFIRSVGLGSDLYRPHSLVLDARGIYFDPTGPSALEDLCNEAAFDAEELARAHAVRSFLVAHGLSKYNTDLREAAGWRDQASAQGRTVILVPGQVEDDASILHGCAEVRTNMGLLQAVRLARPDAFIVYKPHPDVLAANRRGRVALQAAMAVADHVETRLSVVSCVEGCDEVHTMTSLTGFDALLRGKRVTTYGMPFYAGWGLTEDLRDVGGAQARRTRRLTLDELVVAALLRYPLYWDWELRGYSSCEAVLHRLRDERDALQAQGRLGRLRLGAWRRRLRLVALVLRFYREGWARR